MLILQDLLSPEKKNDAEGRVKKTFDFLFTAVFH